ncbi:hypothetical protein AB0A74_24735 [Saccharothrix sp. NPDC042600]|uniref:hypothetical protein n=1 Tax=Saccharothrix TaxID=2071 RepID=UPI0033E9E424|nr:hypothetical protein GCM10017745_18080 [Saccharothrix mutabilis subsp. capreolus]
MSRADEVNRTFLLWLYDNNDRYPNPQVILETGAAPGGTPVTLDEVKTCSRYLAAAGLIKGFTALGGQMPSRVHLTDDGLRCVHEYEGDVQAWNARHTPRWDQSVHVTSGRDAQVTAHSSHVSQVQNTGDINISELAKAARLALESHPVFGPVAAEVRQASQDILDEIDKPEPDQGRLRALGKRLKTALPLTASTATIVKFILDGLGAAGIG